ncbi:hypothetical protein FBD94_14685 [Pedobacter hiemivivus]|uniref:WG repeat-containing protein n=1 Tax=Pedobacter hiemivivus TaxID=2530454 RepID=A0A4U1G916_9SPHI|nr:hypothetical protein [Pedobacter hiemivivus]TKC60158.1 hypothetical protein FBD94_14685 [Pedobacter hiemivivus]
MWNVKSLIILVFISAILEFSCTEQMDAKKAAEEYCKCMNAKDFQNRPIYAGTICHAELVEKNRFYRIFFIDKRDEILSKKLTKSTLDSVDLYMQIFDHNIPLKMREANNNVICFLEDREVLDNTESSDRNGRQKNGLILEDHGLTEYYYKGGKKNGVFKNYFKRNRKLHILGFYKDDEPVGSWYFFNQEGGIYLIEDIKGSNKSKEVRRADGVMVKPTFMSYRKEYDSKTGEVKREGLALFYENVEDGFYRYGYWKEY